MEFIRKKMIEMSEEDYLDDPITLFTIDTPVDKPSNTTCSATCLKSKLVRPAEFNLEEEQKEFTVYGLNSSLTLPVRFFNISKNLIALGKCRPLNVKLANCRRIPFCKKFLQTKNKKRTRKDKISPGLNTINNFILDLFDPKKAKKTSKSMHNTATITYGENLEIESKENTVTTVNFRENTGLLGLKITSEPAEDNDRNIYNLAVDRTVSDKKTSSNVLDNSIRSKHNSKALKEVKEKVSSLTVSPKPCHSDETKNIILTKTEGSNSKTGGDSNEIQKISSKEKKHRKPRCDKGIKRTLQTDCSKDIISNKLPNAVQDESINQSLADLNKKSLKQKAVSEHLVGKKIKFSASASDHNEKITKKYFTKEYLIDNNNSKKNVTVNESKLNHNNPKAKNTLKPVNGPKINKESKSYNMPKTNDEAKTNIENNTCSKTDVYCKAPESKLDPIKPSKDASASLKCQESNIRSSLPQKHEKVPLSKKSARMMKNNTIDVINDKKAFNTVIDDGMSTCPTPIINHDTNYINNTHKDFNMSQIDDRMNTCPTPIINHDSNYMNNAYNNFNMTQIDDIMNTCPTPIINHNSNYINNTQKELNMPQLDDSMSTCPTPIKNNNSNYIYNSHKDFNMTQIDDRMNTCPTPIINNNTNYINKGNNAQQMDDRMSSCPTPILANIPNDIKVQTVDQINKGYDFKTGAELVTPFSTAETPKTAANGAGALLSIKDIKKEKCDDAVQIKQEIIEKEAQVTSHALKINHSNVNLVKPMPNDKVSKCNTIKTVDSQRDRGVYQRNYEVPPQNSLLIPLPHGPPPPLGPFNYPPPTNTNFNQGMMQYTMNSAPCNDIYSNLLGSDGYQQIPQHHNNNYPKKAPHLPLNLTLNNLNIHPNTCRNLPSVPQNLSSNLQVISCNTGLSSNIPSNPPVSLNLSQNLSDIPSKNNQNMSNISLNNNMPQNMSNIPLNNNMPQNMSNIPLNNNMPPNMSNIPLNINIPPPNMSSDMSWYQQNTNSHFGTPPNFIPSQQRHAQNTMMMHHNATNFIPPPPPPPVTSYNKKTDKSKTVVRVSTIPKQVTKTLNCNKTNTPLLETPVYPTPFLQTPYSTATTLNVKMGKLLDPVIRRYLTKKSSSTNKTPGNNNVPLIHGKIPTQNIISLPKDKFIAISKLVDSISKENNKKATTLSRNDIRVETSPSSELAYAAKKPAAQPKNSKKISINDYKKRGPTDDKGIVDLCD